MGQTNEVGTPDLNSAGIARSGSPGTYTYGVVGTGTRPVTYVSFYDAARYANWLHNGGGSGDTETGAYTLLGGTPTPSNGLTVTRNGGATVWIPSENEWYKAAYYDPSAGGPADDYWLYYGTFDQGGNVWEWNDTIITSSRGLRGGSWISSEDGLQASSRDGNDPSGENDIIGFRVATVPEPTVSVSLMFAGGLLLARRKRPSAL